MLRFFGGIISTVEVISIVLIWYSWWYYSIVLNILLLHTYGIPNSIDGNLPQYRMYLSMVSLNVLNTLQCTDGLPWHSIDDILLESMAPRRPPGWYSSTLSNGHPQIKWVIQLDLNASCSSFCCQDASLMILRCSYWQMWLLPAELSNIEKELRLILRMNSAYHYIWWCTVESWMIILCGPERCTITRRAIIHIIQYCPAYKKHHFQHQDWGPCDASRFKAIGLI